MKIQKTQANARVIAIEKTPIELCRLLKFAALVQSGGEAKQMIADGRVRVNGFVETRRRKKLTTGDLIELEGEQIQIG